MLVPQGPALVEIPQQAPGPQQAPARLLAVQREPVQVPQELRLARREPEQAPERARLKPERARLEERESAQPGVAVLPDQELQQGPHRRVSR